MGLRKTDEMEHMPVSEWNKKEARRCIRNRTIVQIAIIIIGTFAVSLILYILNDFGIIKIPR